MIILRALLAFALLMPALSTGGKAHEFWISPEKFTVAPGEEIRAALRNGQDFEGSSLAWFDPRNARVGAVVAGEMRPIEGRPGDDPALRLTAPDEGLVVLVHQTTPSLLTYDDWDTVLAFAAQKDFPWFAERHDARGLPRDRVRETYTRYSKALVGVGDAEGEDSGVGLAVELVALANPYSDRPADGLPVRLLYRGAPRTDAQVEVFDKAPDGTVTQSALRTDEAGEVQVPVTPGHSYLLNHVELREPAGPDPDPKAMWESLWASLTFAVPAD